MALVKAPHEKEEELPTGKPEGLAEIDRNSCPEIERIGETDLFRMGSMGHLGLGKEGVTIANHRMVKINNIFPVEKGDRMFTERRRNN